MIQIREYLTTKVSKSKIKATDETIHQIVKEQMDKYGHNCDLNHIDVSKVTSISFLFNCSKNNLGESYSDLNPDISKWDVSSVQYMPGTFQFAKNFNSDISDWNVSNVTAMRWMFEDCKKFNKDLSRWDVSNVTEMTGMFAGCEKFDQNLSKWNVNKVTIAHTMFEDCPIAKNHIPKFNNNTRL